MKLRLLLPLLLCALTLAGCYRQAEEEFQQVSSSEVETAEAPITVVTTEPSLGTAALDDSAATSQYITPEPPPGQVEQPTLAQPTGAVVIAVTPEVATTPNFVIPSPTTPFQDTLDPESNCVYTVVSGDTLFRLALAYGTTVEALQSLNDMDSDALQIGQLLLIPGCETPPPPTAAVVPTATDEPVPTVALPEGQRVHVVSAGETLRSIALRYGVTVEHIAEVNNLADPDRVNAGQELLITEETAQPTEAAETEPTEATELEPTAAATAAPEAEATADA